MAHFESVFTSRTEDLDRALTVEGDLPPTLRGTFYAIGGTACQVGGDALHLLDAHGRVSAFAVRDGQASLRARMVDTPLWRAERAAPGIVKRRLFRNKAARWSNLFDAELGNPAGHNVVPWGRAVVATNDPGFFVLDPETLATRGPAPLAPRKGATFSPMPRRDPVNGRHVVTEIRPGMRDTLVVREVDDEFAVVSERSYRIGRGASFFHDVAFTARYYLLIQFASVSLPTFLWGARSVAEALRFDPATTPVLHLLPRAGGEPITIPLPGGRTHFHFWNAYEEGDKVIADAIGYAGEVTLEHLMPPSARPAGRTPSPTPPSASFRYTLDPRAGSASEELLTDCGAEAPEIRADRRGRRYRFGWAPAPGARGDEPDPNFAVWYHALARHDFEACAVEVWDAGPSAYVSPAAFVASGEREDEGHVLALVQDAASGTSELAVFDAGAIARGPLARIRGAGLLGAVSHVSFAARA